MTTRRHTIAGVAFAALVFAAVTPWVLRPWFLAVDTLPQSPQGLGATGDADLHLNIWILGWIAYAIRHAPAHVFDGNIFYPAPNTIAGSESMLAHLPVTVPTLALTGNALTVLKVMALESFVLAGVAMFLLVRHHTRDGAAAVVAGACYTFTQFRAHTVYQPQYLGSAGIPFALLAIDVWLRRGHARAFAGLAASMALQALSCVYLGYFAFLTVPIYALARVASRPPGTRGRATVALGTAIGLGALLVVPAFLPYLHGRAAGMIPQHNPDLVSAFSLSPARYLNPVLLQWTGPVPALLTLLGLGSRLWRRRADDPAPWSATWALAAAGVLWSFGPYLSVGRIRLPLPYAAALSWLPGFSTIRAPARCVLVVSAALSALAGYGASGIWSRWKPGVRWLTAAVLVAACAGLAAPVPSPTTRARLGGFAAPVYRWLATQPTDDAILEVPVARDENDIFGNLRSSRYMLASTIHWHPILNGYTAYVPGSASFLQAIARRLPAADALALLIDSVDVRWIVVHRGDLATQEREAWSHAELRGLEPVGTFEDDVVYAVRARPERPWRPLLLARASVPQPTTLEGTPIAPLSPECRRGRIVSVTPPPALFPVPHPSEIPVRFANDSDCPWPGLEVRRDGLVGLAYAWTAPSGKRYDPAPITRLLHDVPAGATIDDTALVLPPGPEFGVWTLDILLVQDGNPAPIAEASVPVDVRPLSVGRDPTR